jgi:hypothetical protein
MVCDEVSLTTAGSENKIFTNKDGLIFDGVIE